MKSSYKLEWMRKQWEGQQAEEGEAKPRRPVYVVEWDQIKQQVKKNFLFFCRVHWLFAITPKDYNAAHFMAAGCGGPA